MHLEFHDPRRSQVAPSDYISDAILTVWFHRVFKSCLEFCVNILQFREQIKASSFGYIDAIHSGTFMGLPATGKRVKIKYTDFWKVTDGKIADNWVTVDFASVMAQLGVDVFSGEGWEKFDEGRAEPSQPERD